jgi:pyruvate ferredoxin oxidoreductase beta subunit
MVLSLKELTLTENFAPGHRLCPGCGSAMAARMCLKAERGRPIMVVNATGCIEVSSTPFPYTAWRIPYVHSLFENAGATASGIEAAYKYMLKKRVVDRDVDIIVLAGDGGTFDIGIQALSGALERGHDFVYICYDNEAYMNTGIQRSGATPRGAATTTSPAGKVIPGKRGFKKDLIAIAAAHHIEYAATATVGFPNDYITKVRKALEVEGPAVIHVLAPCPLGWRASPSDTVRLARLAVQTTIWPLYEVERDIYRLNMKIMKPIPIEEYLKLQGRFSHIMTPQAKDELEAIRRGVQENWQRILMLCGEA